MMKPEHLARNNVILLVSLLILILFYPLFQADKMLVRDLLLSTVVFSVLVRIRPNSATIYISHLLR